MSFEISERDENRIESWPQPISLWKEHNTLHWFEMFLFKFYAKIRKCETKAVKSTKPSILFLKENNDKIGTVYFNYLTCLFFDLDFAIFIEREKSCKQQSVW